MSKPHDMGGRPAGALDLTEKDPSFFDQRVDALYALLTGHHKQVFTMDQVRRTVESMSEEDYASFTYYERWLHAIALLMIEHGIASQKELYGD